ncbi:MAG: adenosylcobinamide-phosphate synthase CbiB [Gammaproteobacteria bacterium]|nr:adenosylcobinamide-phosphate synthase CbiB [Gammaproteobacteria bacterium]
MLVAWLCVLAVMLDWWWGEPRRWHPLVGFGRLAAGLESRLNGAGAGRWQGVLAVSLLLLPFALLAAWLAALPKLGWVFSVLGLYLCIGYQSLREHVLAVRDALLGQGLDAGRASVGRIVSRQTDEMTEADVTKAAIESALENGNDALFGALFWFAVAGLPGVIVYRLANTLDAMWGYKNQRFLHFGWAAARLDDVLNFVPARLTAISYSLVGNWQQAVAAARAQQGKSESPNAGLVMAAGAGALGIRVGGDAKYHGKIKHKPVLGEGALPAAEDIGRALTLVQRALLVWLVGLVLVGLLLTLL